MKSNTPFSSDRRRFMQSGTLLFSAAMLSRPESLFAGEKTPPNRSPLLRIGLITDAHYADKKPRINRYYRESVEKIEVFVKACEKLRPDFTVELGDLIDSSGNVNIDLKTLRDVNGIFRKSAEERHYVLGNHCVETLKKDEFIREVEKKETFYSFDRKGYHFIVLDGCFRKDGIPYERNNAQWTDAGIPDKELAWLREDMQKNRRPAIVFAHQCLDTDDRYSVFNSSEVRKVLENSDRVKLVLQGHFHKGRQQTINGISYCTLHAMTEGSGPKNNAFSFLDIFDDGSMVLNGYYKQESLSWT